MGELEAHVTAMAWDWDMEDINPNEDGGKLWVPMTPQMLRKHKIPRSMRSGHSMPPTMPLRKMTVYMVQLN